MTIEPLHYITQEVPGISHAQLALLACEKGIKWVQLRVKNKSWQEYEAIAQETKKICKQWNATFIINDHVLLAKEIKADGVHLGKKDMSPTEARQILGPEYIIGGTANDFHDLQTLVKDGVDYIGLGPLRFTSTKEQLSPILGIDGYSQLMKQYQQKGFSTPVIAIGGIVPEDVLPLLNAGLYGIAVSGAITHAKDKGQVIKAFYNEIKRFNGLEPTPSPSQEGNHHIANKRLITTNSIYLQDTEIEAPSQLPSSEQG